MRNVGIIVLLVLTLVSTAVAVQTTLQYFSARSSGTTISVEWRANAEDNVIQYEIERAGDDQVFRFVASVPAKGSNQAYSYVDNEAFGKQEGANGSIAKTYFTYRLKIVNADKTSSYSNSTGVSHSVSSIKRTWGMIKEMFR